MLDRLPFIADALGAAIERRRESGGARLATVAAVLAADHGPVTDRASRPDDAISALADRFDLNEVDERLLAVAVAGDLDANIALAYGLLAGSDVPSWPTVAVAFELCGLGSLDAGARQRLNELAPLRLHGLFELRGDGPWLTRRLVVPTRVATHLFGDDTPDPRVLRHLGEPIPIDLAPADVVRQALDRGVRLCWVRSPLGAAGAGIAVAAVARSGSVPVVVDLARVADRDEVVAVTQAAVLEAGLVGRPLVLLGAERLAPSDGPSLVDLLTTCVVPIICVSARAWDSSWSPRVPLVVEAPRLDTITRSATWLDVTAAHGVEVDVDDPRWVDVLAMRLDPTQIVRATRDADLSATVEGRVADVGDVRRAVGRLSSTRGDAAVRTTASFDDLVLPANAMAELRRLVSWARRRDQVLAQGPLNGAGGKGSGIAALFGGGPGTGKTLAAHVVADALGLELMRVDLSSVVDKYVGETEKNLERIFHEAESLNVVLFFDEADALFGARSAVSDARDRYANLEVSYLLQRIEDFDGITVLATNLRGNLDPAFSRRLQFMITFPDPDPATRLRLWEQHLSHVAHLDQADPPDLALLAEHGELAGGDIRNVVLSAAYAAAEDNHGRVGMAHLVTATLREHVKLRKRAPEPIASWGIEKADGSTGGG